MMVMPRPPRCAARNCKRPANRLVVQVNLLGKGDFVTRLCDVCLTAHMGLGRGHEYLIVCRVLRWKSWPQAPCGYVGSGRLRG